MNNNRNKILRISFIIIGTVLFAFASYAEGASLELRTSRPTRLSVNRSSISTSRISHRVTLPKPVGIIPRLTDMLQRKSYSAGINPVGPLVTRMQLAPRVSLRRIRPDSSARSIMPGHINRLVDRVARPTSFGYAGTRSARNLSSINRPRPRTAILPVPNGLSQKNMDLYLKYGK